MLMLLRLLGWRLTLFLCGVPLGLFAALLYSDALSAEDTAKATELQQGSLCFGAIALLLMLPWLYRRYMLAQGPRKKRPDDTI